MDVYYAIGVVGMIFIVTGWILSLDVVPSPKLSGFYAIGSILLAYYAYSLGDPIFLSLNLLASIIAVCNLIRAIKLKGSV